MSNSVVFTTYPTRPMFSCNFKYFLYISLIFVLIALIQGDYLQVPKLVSPSALALSFAALFAAFLIEAVPWQMMILGVGLIADLRDALCSIGLTIFGKYIPGKVWTLLGRAAYIGSRNSSSRGALMSAAINGQLLSLWCGLMLGGAGLLHLDALRELRWYLLGGLLLLTAAIFTDSVNRAFARSLQALRREPIVLPRLNFSGVARTVPWYLLQWLLWCGGFLLLVDALTATPFTWWIGLAFPLAASLGILALIVPGGLGVREGILVLYLAGAGLPIQEATIISVASRLWFLIGECFIFAVAALIVRAERRANRSPPAPTHDS